MAFVPRVKASTAILGIALATMMFVSATPARAQSTKPLKGNWTVMLSTPIGTLPLPMAFRPNGHGTVDVGGDTLPLVYREDASTFSVSFEWDASVSPTGQDVTVVIRGTKTTDNAFTGNAILITDVPDGTSTVGFVTTIMPVTGQRQ
jgi:hypothetical protein